MKQHALGAWRVVVSFAILLGLWQLAWAFSTYPDSLFPSPGASLAAIGELAQKGRLWTDIAASMYRYVAGYALAAALGVLLGLVLGWFSRAWAYVNPVVQFIRPISPMAWLPFIVLLLGIGDIPAIAIVFIAAFFPVLIGTVSAVRAIDPIYLKVAKNFAVTGPRKIASIVLPAAFPQIMNSLRTAIGTAWIFLVAGEMVGAQTGLGYLIIDARNNLSADQLLAAIIVIGIIGFALDTTVRFIDTRVQRAWGREV